MATTCYTTQNQEPNASIHYTQVEITVGPKAKYTNTDRCMDYHYRSLQGQTVSEYVTRPEDESL